MTIVGPVERGIVNVVDDDDEDEKIMRGVSVFDTLKHVWLF